MAYFECLNEMKLIVDLMYEGGTMEMWNSVSDTAEFGGLTVGPEIVDEGVRENMEAALDDVQDGTFAREWILENQAGRPEYAQRRAAMQDHDIEDVGARLRALFSWADSAEAE
jgi:ketol-acid reductoisomerase